MVSGEVFIIYMISTTLIIIILAIMLIKNINRTIELYKLLMLVKSKNTQRYKYLLERIEKNEK